MLVAKSITKDFPGVRALNQVDFEVQTGEIHALCGENGAGKSTLMKILAGVYPTKSFQGDIHFHGQAAQFFNTADSMRAGIAVVYQELSLVSEMTVAENIFLGKEPHLMGILKKEQLRRKTEKLLKSLGLSIDPEVPVKDLGIGQKQLVEISKALSQEPRLLILDEPTSALSQQEIKVFMNLLVHLKSQGVSIILITHKLDEVFAVADRITVFRDGKSIKTISAKDSNEDSIISLMVGRQIQDIYPKGQRNLGEKVLEIKNLSLPHPRVADKNLLNDISLSVRKGEILGVSGLMGSGRTEMLMALFGAFSSKASGEIYVEGKRIRIHSPKDAMRAGLSLVTEDRKRFGLILDEPVSQNITLSTLKDISYFNFLNFGKELNIANEWIKQFRIKCPSVSAPVKNLSGGNQQKVVLSKCLLNKPKVLFLDEPTRGIDVGAKSEIYDYIFKLSQQGVAIVLVSSELPEILGLCDRVLVMCEGEVTGELTSDNMSEQSIMAAATRFKTRSSPKVSQSFAQTAEIQA